MDMPMQPSPMADTSGPFLPSLRVCIEFLPNGNPLPIARSRTGEPLLRVGDAQIADAIDVAFEPVARLYGPHAGGRPGHDEITGPQRYQPGQIRDCLGHAPYHLREIPLL